MAKAGAAEPFFSHPLEEAAVAAAAEEEAPPAGAAEKRFRLWYVGCSCLDRRTTLPMLPWLVAEIRRRSQKQEPSAVPPREVLLLLGSPHLRCVPSAAAAAASPAVFIFEHKAQHISRFIHNSHDLTYFAYLIKAQPDDPESQVACHVFRASDPNQASPEGSRRRAPLPAGRANQPPAQPRLSLPSPPSVRAVVVCRQGRPEGRPPSSPSGRAGPVCRIRVPNLDRGEARIQILHACGEFNSPEFLWPVAIRALSLSHMVVVKFK
ncbi:UNVERIFIED_CONTAM: hypothetical protein K2H54_027291 [Gekko kuhli]